jgi:hypothetical protein
MLLILARGLAVLTNFLQFLEARSVTVHINRSTFLIPECGNIQIGYYS